MQRSALTLSPVLQELLISATDCLSWVPVSTLMLVLCGGESVHCSSNSNPLLVMLSAAKLGAAHSMKFHCAGHNSRRPETTPLGQEEEALHSAAAQRGNQGRQAPEDRKWCQSNRR